jgi:hypothetical protein
MVDLTAPIFDPIYRYPCYVPYITTLNMDEVNEFGMRGTGVEELDDKLDVMRVYVHITIERMVDLYMENYPISISNGAAAKQIYEAITLYTQYWEMYIKGNSMNTSAIPIDDLLALEEFAMRIRPHAVSGASDGPVEVGLTNLLDEYFSPMHNIVLDHDTELLALFRDYKKRVNHYA